MTTLMHKLNGQNRLGSFVLFPCSHTIVSFSTSAQHQYATLTAEDELPQVDIDTLSVVSTLDSGDFGTMSVRKIPHSQQLAVVTVLPGFTVILLDKIVSCDLYR